jgi:Vacuolar protein sorting protein 36 Vps36
MGITIGADYSYNRKFKSPNHQDGTVYLTNLRVCYVDEIKPMLHSVAVDLEKIDKIETSVFTSFSLANQRLDFLSHHQK